MGSCKVTTQIVQKTIQVFDCKDIKIDVLK